MTPFGLGPFSSLRAGTFPVPFSGDELVSVGTVGAVTGEPQPAGGYEVGVGWRAGLRGKGGSGWWGEDSSR